MSGYTQISKILNDSTFLHTDYEVLLFIQKTLYLLVSYHRDGFVHGSISNDSIEYNPVTGDVRLGSIRVKYEVMSSQIMNPEMPSEVGKQKLQEQDLFPTYSLIPSLRPNNVNDYLVADTRNLYNVLKNIIKSHFKKIPNWLTPLIEQWDSPFGKTSPDKKPSIAALEAGISYVSQLITGNVVSPDTNSEDDEVNFEDQDEIIEDEEIEESDSSSSSSSSSDSSCQDDNEKVDNQTDKSSKKKKETNDVFFTKTTTIGQLSGGYKKDSHQRYMTLIGPGVACSKVPISLGCQSNGLFGDVSVQIGYKKMLKMGKDKGTSAENNNGVDDTRSGSDNDCSNNKKIPACTVRIGMVEERVLERIKREKQRMKAEGKTPSTFTLKDMNRILDGLRGLVWAPTGAVNHGVLGGDLVNGEVNEKQYIEIKPVNGESKTPYILNRFDNVISGSGKDILVGEDESKNSTDVADTYKEVISESGKTKKRIALFPHTFLASPFGTDDILTIRDSTSASNFSSSIVKLTINGKEVGVFSMKKWLESGYNGMRLEKEARKSMKIPKFRLIVIITSDEDSVNVESNWTCSILTQSMRNCLIATHLSLYPQLGKITGVELPMNQLRNSVGFGYRQQSSATAYETLPTRTPNIHTGYPYTQLIMTGSSSGNTQITPYSIVLNSFTNPTVAVPYDFSFKLLKKSGKVLMKIRSVNTGASNDPRGGDGRRSSERGSGRGSFCFTPSQLNGDTSNQLSSLDQRRHSSLSTSSRTMFVEIRTDMTIVITIHNGSNIIGSSTNEDCGSQGGEHCGKRKSDVGGAGTTSDIMLSKPTRFVCGPRKSCNLQEGDIIRIRLSSGGLWLAVNGIWLHYDKDSSDEDNAIPPGIKLDHSGVRALILPMGVVLQVMTPVGPQPLTRTAKALLAKCQTPLVAFDPFSHTRNVEIDNTGISLHLNPISGKSHSCVAFVDVPLKVSKRTLVPNSGVCAVFRVLNFGSGKSSKKPSGRYGFMVVSNYDVSQFLSEADDSDIELTSLKIPHFAVTSDGLMSSRWNRTNEDGSTSSKKSIVTSGASKREISVGDIIALFLDVKLGGVIVLRNGVPIANSIVNGTSSGSSKVVSDPESLLEGRTKEKTPDAFYIDSTASYRIGVFVDSDGSREGFKCELLSVFGQ